MAIVRRRVLVSGFVQGVFYRAHARRVADSLGVAGWVRNLPDGRVELVLEGERSAVDQVIVWARSGPPHAVVSELAVEHEEPTEQQGFRVR